MTHDVTLPLWLAIPGGAAAAWAIVAEIVRLVAKLKARHKDARTAADRLRVRRPRLATVLRNYGEGKAARALVHLDELIETVMDEKACDALLLEEFRADLDAVLSDPKTQVAMDVARRVVVAGLALAKP